MKPKESEEARNPLPTFLCTPIQGKGYKGKQGFSQEKDHEVSGGGNLLSSGSKPNQRTKGGIKEWIIKWK